MKVVPKIRRAPYICIDIDCANSNLVA